MDIVGAGHCCNTHRTIGVTAQMLDGAVHRVLRGRITLQRQRAGRGIDPVCLTCPLHRKLDRACGLGIGRNAIGGIGRFGIGLILLLWRWRWRLPCRHLCQRLPVLLQCRLQAFARCIEFQRDIAFGSNTIMPPLILRIALILLAVRGLQ